MLFFRHRFRHGPVKYEYDLMRDNIRSSVDNVRYLFGICSAFVEKGGRAELRHVSIGPRNTLEAVVLNGLEEGERVVLHPSDRRRSHRRSE